MCHSDPPQAGKNLSDMLERRPFGMSLASDIPSLRQPSSFVKCTSEDASLRVT